jgi:hypothetical protein
MTSVAVDSTFDGEVEGWTKPAPEQTSLLGGLLCIDNLTCPTITDEFHATGGVENSGFIETKEGGLVGIGLLAESTGSWESPEFTYLGVAGQRPTKVELTLARRAQLAGLLALSGAQATYSVELVDQTTPAGTVVVVNGATLAGAEAWKSASTPIAPTLLEKGDNYKVRIRTTFVTPAAVIPSGGVGYDNIELSASRDEVEEGPKGREAPEDQAGPEGSGGDKGPSDSGGSTGTSGAKGLSGADGSGSGGGAGEAGNGGAGGARGGGPSLPELRTVIGSRGIAGPASLHRGKLFVTGKCPRSIKRACTVRIQGLLNRHKVATSSGRAKIAKGGKHRFTVAVTPKARHAVRRQGKLLVKEWVRVGAARVVVYKRVRLVRR